MESSVELTVGEVYTIGISVDPTESSENVEWTTSDSSVATVNQDGRVTAVSAGAAKITATATDGSGKSAACKVIVEDESTPTITSLQIDASMTVKVGVDERISISVEPEDASGYVEWTSSDSTIATVSDDGLVSGLQAGIVTITASATDGSGLSDTCEVTVTDTIEVEMISFTKAPDKLPSTSYWTISEEDILFVPEDATDKTLTYSIADESIATVDSSGKVTAHSPGETTLTATTTNGKTATVSIMVGQAIESITFTEDVDPVPAGQTVPLMEYISVEPSNVDSDFASLIWISTNTSVATVDSAGMVTAVAPGTTTITVSARGGTTESCTLTVTEAETETGPTLTMGTPEYMSDGRAMIYFTLSDMESGVDYEVNLADHTYYSEDNDSNITSDGIGHIRVIGESGTSHPVSLTVTGKVSGEIVWTKDYEDVITLTMP